MITVNFRIKYSLICIVVRYVIGTKLKLVILTKHNIFPFSDVMVAEVSEVFLILLTRYFISQQFTEMSVHRSCIFIVSPTSLLI